MMIGTILIVDDSAMDCHIISRILTGSGYQVGTAESGEEGVIKIKETQPDLILMTVVMPGINGFQVTRILARNETIRHTPIILCTNDVVEALPPVLKITAVSLV